MPLHHDEQVLGEQLQDPMSEAVAGFREGLGADFPAPLSAVVAVGGERIQLVLHAGSQAGQQRRDQPGKGELALAEKGGGLEADCAEECGQVTNAHTIFRNSRSNRN